MEPRGIWEHMDEKDDVETVVVMVLKVSRDGEDFVEDQVNKDQ
jgi:hypothetical protein